VIRKEEQFQFPADLSRPTCSRRIFSLVRRKGKNVTTTEGLFAEKGEKLRSGGRTETPD